MSFRAVAIFTSNEEEIFNKKPDEDNNNCLLWLKGGCSEDEQKPVLFLLNLQQKIVEKCLAWNLELLFAHKRIITLQGGIKVIEQGYIFCQRDFFI